MGAADIIPGVSGGTIAYITGIYETLIASLQSINIHALKKLFRFELRIFWQVINGNFLVSLLSGILLSIFTLSNIIVFLLAHHSLLLFAFFFGLIAASAVVIVKKIHTHSFFAYVAGIAGVVFALMITSLSPVSTPETRWFIFLSGAIAICAMILPGISGSFILLLLGKYTFILESINEFNFVVIIIFGSGCVIGLLGFSKTISKLLQHYHDQTMLLLAGFMVAR